MSIRILTKNAVDNTNIDGARQNHFNAGMQSGIVKGALNEGKFFAITSNEIALDTCELRLCGHQVVIDDLQALTLLNKPTQPTKYSMIAEISVSDTSVPTFKLFIQPQNTPLIQDNLFKTISGKGTYQLRIGNFTLGTTGFISDVVRTADIITGGGDGASVKVEFNATAEQLSSSSKPEAHIDYNEETGKYDMRLGIPAGEGTNVSVGDVVLPEWKADFVENERQKSKNLLGANLDKSHEEYGINFTINNDGSITANGTATWNATFKMDKITLPAGNYFASIRDKNNNFVSNAKLQIHYDSVYKDIQNKSFSLDDTKYCDFEFYIVDGTTINNETFYIQLEKGTQATEYQSYNGAIVHEKDIQRHIITSSLIAGFDVPNYDAYHIVPLVENKKIGHKLTMDGNGGVVIGAGVRNILINVSANSYVSAIGYHRLRVYKNNTVVVFKYEQTKDTAGRAIPLDITPFLLDVAEGDVITLRFQTSSLASLQGGNEMPTFMTVEVVD